MSKRRATRKVAEGPRQQSIRFAVAQVRWLRQEARTRGISVNAVVRRLLDDHLTLFAAPPTMREVLERDRRALDLDPVGYLQELLTQRYRELIRAEVEAARRRDRSQG